MRHTELYNKTNTLPKFKKKVDKILQQIITLNHADKKKVFNYVHKHLKGHDSFLTSTKQSTVVNSGRRKSKIKPRSELHNIIKKPKSKISFTCQVCLETKNSKTNLLKHLEILHIGTPLSCIKCRRTFNSELSYNWHKSQLCGRRKRLLVKNFKCDQCSKEFVLQRHLLLHQLGHKNNNCSYCNVVLTRRDQLIQHLLVNHNVRLQRDNFKCAYCKKVFIKRRSLYCHLQKHSPFACIQCGNICDNLTEYNNHVKEHEKEKPWQCHHCKDRFSRRQLYFTHLYRHERYKCLTCKETYASKVRLYRHKQRGHTVLGLEPKLCCPYCDLSFYHALLLQKHVLRHKERNSITSCKYCNKVFPTINLYHKHCLENNHNHVEAESDAYICECCGQQFGKKYLLDQHLVKKHGKEQSPYSCEYCSYTTKFKPNITRHLSLHFTKERQYVCDHCGKLFSNVAVLTDHINYVHKQVKQYKCLKCEKSFKRNTELTRHQSTHSDLRPYNCVLCINTYKRISHLRRHEKNVHGVVNKTNRVQRLQTDENGTYQQDQQKLSKNDSVTITQKPNILTEFVDFDVSDLILQNESPENSTVQFGDVALKGFQKNTIQIIQYVNLPVNNVGMGQKTIILDVEKIPSELNIDINGFHQE